MRNRLFGPSVVVMAVFAGIIVAVFATGSTFDQRCSRAGYAGAAHERCVLRLYDGGPVYEENILARTGGKQ